jgi:hypothetical protein
MTDVSGNGTITIDGVVVQDVVFYWLTITEEPGELVAEGSISGSEELMRKIKTARHVTLAPESGPAVALRCAGGRNGVRWIKAIRIAH